MSVLRRSILGGCEPCFLPGGSTEEINSQVDPVVKRNGSFMRVKWSEWSECPLHLRPREDFNDPLQGESTLTTLDRLELEKTVHVCGSKVRGIEQGEGWLSMILKFNFAKASRASMCACRVEQQKEKLRASGLPGRT